MGVAAWAKVVALNKGADGQSGLKGVNREPLSKGTEMGLKVSEQHSSLDSYSEVLRGVLDHGGEVTAAIGWKAATTLQLEANRLHQGVQTA